MTILEPSTRTSPPRSPGQFEVVGGRDVHVRGLTIAYSQGGQVVTPLKGFNLYAPASRVTAVIGRSGSGKTSLLSCIAAMLKPAAGAIWLGGIEVSALSGHLLDHYRRNHVGVVHQSYNLIPSLSALENVVVPLRLAGVSRRESSERAETLLDELGLIRFAKSHPGNLSGGQQQRVAVARALATNPALLIADEPTAHLDGSSVEDVCQLLRTIADAGRTVIMSTHDERLLHVADQQVQL